MKTIRISDEAFEFLKFKAESEKRTYKDTLDLFIEIFKEEEDETMASKSVSQSKSRQVQKN